jgi:hypothetical protein
MEEVAPEYDVVVLGTGMPHLNLIHDDLAVWPTLTVMYRSD